MIDFCFIVAPQNCGWVLDRIAKEIGKRMEGEVAYCYDLNNIPEAKHYFVTHYSLLPAVFQKVNPANARVNCLFTHESVKVESLLVVLNLCNAVIAENPREFMRLMNYGVNPSILHFVVECGDNMVFKPHARTGKGPILVSSACYPRKNPSKIREIMRLLEHRDFIVIGKDWGESRFPSNVRYYDYLDYEHYPEKYSVCDVFLSAAQLEGGGPGGLIEAMHSNLIPVVSDTGNAREYIISGYNGFIFPVDSDAGTIAKLIEDAYSRDPQNSLPYNDVWQTVQHYTWDYYALQMKEIMLNDTIHDDSSTEACLK